MNHVQAAIAKSLAITCFLHTSFLYLRQSFVLSCLHHKSISHTYLCIQDTCITNAFIPYSRFHHIATLQLLILSCIFLSQSTFTISASNFLDEVFDLQTRKIVLVNVGVKELSVCLIFSYIYLFFQLSMSLVPESATFPGTQS